MRTAVLESLRAVRIPSPLGDLFAVTTEGGALVRLDFVGSTARARDEDDLERGLAAQGARVRWEAAARSRVERELGAYFAGSARSFSLPVELRGTDFQRRVWTALMGVPHGSTTTYADLAKRVGSPGASRAVGRANATNPISIVVPCHRVVGSDGSLTGYAGGLERKRALLELEGALHPSASPV